MFRYLSMVLFSWSAHMSGHVKEHFSRHSSQVKGVTSLSCNSKLVYNYRPVCGLEAKTAEDVDICTSMHANDSMKLFLLEPQNNEGTSEFRGVRCLSLATKVFDHVTTPCKALDYLSFS